MPIPPFDHNLVLPPHTGNPTNSNDLSPYECTSVEFCQRFATSSSRRAILFRFLAFRKKLRGYGMLDAIQWIDGSFVENIEQQQNRAPRDLDIVTIYWQYDLHFQETLIASFPEFANPILAKQNYKLDHYPFDAGHSPLTTLGMARYWSQLFSHNRSAVWKGMLSIKLNTPMEDQEAFEYLEALKL